MQELDHKLRRKFLSKLIFPLLLKREAGKKYLPCLSQAFDYCALGYSPPRFRCCTLGWFLHQPSSYKPHGSLQQIYTAKAGATHGSPCAWSCHHWSGCHSGLQHSSICSKPKKKQHHVTLFSSQMMSLLSSHKLMINWLLDCGLLKDVNNFSVQFF